MVLLNFTMDQFKGQDQDVDKLVISLSNNHNAIRDEGLHTESPLPLLVNEIAALKGRLESVRVNSPPSSNLEAWRIYLRHLRGWIAKGDLAYARKYHYGTTAVAGWR